MEIQEVYRSLVERVESTRDVRFQTLEQMKSLLTNFNDNEKTLLLAKTNRSILTMELEAQIARLESVLQIETQREMKLRQFLQLISGEDDIELEPEPEEPEEPESEDPEGDEDVPVDPEQKEPDQE